MQHLEAGGLAAPQRCLWVRLGTWLADFLSELNKGEQASEIITRIEAVMEPWDGTGMRREQAMLQLVKGDIVLYCGGNRLRALEFYQQGLERISQGENPWELSLALYKTAFCYGQAGYIRETGQYAQQALAAQRSLGDPELLAGIWAHVGYYYLLSGEHEAGWKVVQEQVASLRRIHKPGTQAVIDEQLAIALFYAGQLDQARSLFEEAIPSICIAARLPYV